MTVKVVDADRPWSDYLVTNHLSGKTYRVALRGFDPGDSYCSCPDFRTNTLGTCKHILRVATKVRRRFTPAQLRRTFRPTNLALHLRYADDVTLRLVPPKELDEPVAAIVAPLLDRAIENLPDLMKRLTRLQKLGQEVVVYPDAEEFIQQRLAQRRLCETTTAIRRDPTGHPLRTTLLRAPCCRINWTAWPLPPEPAGRSWPTTWGLAKRFKVWARPNCWLARPASAKCWSSVRPRSSRSGAAKFIDFAIATCS